jgi:hypothetical protein
MTPKVFRLRPFPATALLIPLDITGTIARRGSTLEVAYELRGDLAALVLPGPARRPARRDHLWQAACLELFLAPRGAPAYWEVNLSPAGHWNIYRFSGYRQGIAPEAAFTSLPFSVRTAPSHLLLTVDLDLTRLAPAAPPLDVAITAVIEDTGGGLTYWALAHPGPQPDFHRREGFLIEL